MPKQLRTFLVFVVAVILLLAAYTLGKNGSAVGAAGGIAVLVGWLFFWNKRQSAELPQTDRVLAASEPSAVPASRKAIINLLRVVFVSLWLIAIAIGAGVFGKSPTLSHVFMACCVIGLVALFTVRYLTVKSR